MKQKKKSGLIGWIFLCCFLTYMTAYLCRVNLSASMEAFAEQKGYSSDLMGKVGAVFFAAYACGQLVNGYISDRVKAKRFILLALCGTMTSNLGMAFAPGYSWLLVFWGINGCFQSMFWCTIIRVLAKNIPAEKRAVVSAGISLAMPPAYVISWGLMGECLDGAKVQWYFLIPALLCLPLMGGWLLLSRRLSVEEEEKQVSKAGFTDTLRFLGKENFLWIAAVCVLHGLLKEGAAFWAPLLISGLEETTSISTHLLSCLLPLSSLLGVLISKAMLRDGNINPYRVLLLLTGAIGLVCLGLMLSHGGLLLVGLIALVAGLCSGINIILVSFLPMQYTEKNMVASIVGFFDFSIYVGAAASTYVLGRVLHAEGFGPLPYIWLGACVLSIVILIPLVIARSKKETA